MDSHPELGLSTSGTVDVPNTSSATQAPDTSSAPQVPSTSSAPPQPSMRSWGKLDLLVLTFNAGKARVDSAAFADRLEVALTSTLPEVVVISLQELSPIKYAYVGGLMLNSFLTPYEDALNIAASRLRSSASTPNAEPTGSLDDVFTDAAVLDPSNPEAQPLTGPLGRRKRSYTLVRQHNVGMTAVMLFARDPSLISQVETAEVGFGTGDLGNKGAAAVRFLYKDTSAPAHEPRSQLTFAAAHLAPMEWNVKRRNMNWQSICSGLLFGNPINVIRRAARAEDDISLIRSRRTGRIADSAASEAPTAAELEEAQRLLAEADVHHSALASHIQDALRDISIYRPGSHLFLAGDLNYRIHDVSPDPKKGHVLPCLSPEDSPHHWRHYLSRDQLLKEKRAGSTLHGFEEPKINFPPTYKYDVLDSPQGAMNEAEAQAAVDRGEPTKVVPFRFATHRWPSWTDRILFLAPPRYAMRALFGGGSEEKREQAEAAPESIYEVHTYDSLPLLPSSDHQPVFMRLWVPLLTPHELGRWPIDELAHLIEEEEEPTRDAAPDQTGVLRRLPYPVDIHAQSRRAAARYRERIIGWNLMFVASKEGIIMMSSLLFLGMGSYWLYYSL